MSDITAVLNDLGVFGGSPVDNLPGLEATDPELLAQFYALAGEMDTGTIYKVTTAEGHAPSNGYKTFAFDLPTRNEDGTWTPGAWCELHEPPLKLCIHGVHVTSNPASWTGTYYDRRIFEVEVKGIQFDTDIHGAVRSDKAVCQTIRLLKEVTTEWKALYHAKEAKRQERERQERAERERVKRQQALDDGKFFMSEDMSNKQIIKQLLRLPCPCCGADAGDWGFRYKLTEREYREYSAEVSFDGSFDVTGGEDGQGDSETVETNLVYTCCGDDVSGGDWEDLIVFASAYTDVYDVVREYLSDHIYG